MKSLRLFAVLFFLLAVILACDLTGAASSVTTVSSTPEEIPTDSKAAADTVAETPAPTRTPAPVSLNAVGPYVLFSSDEDIWIANPDGSFPTRLSDAGPRAAAKDLHLSVSPQGDRLAYVAIDEIGLDLMEVSLPDGEPTTIAHLLDVTPLELNDATSSKAFAFYAVADYESLAWQPGIGRMLAFLSAADGPTADLYVYDHLTQETTRLTDGPSQAVNPSWSPDGKYITHVGVSWVPPFGGAILGANRLDGMWSVDISDESVEPLPVPADGFCSMIGWQDSTHYLRYDWKDSCSGRRLWTVDIETGTVSPVTDVCMYTAPAFSPRNGALLLTGDSACDCSPGDGAFLLAAGSIEPQQLLSQRVYEVSWLPESGVFWAYPEALFSADGKRRYDPPLYEKSFHPAISRSGYEAWEVIENQQGRVVIRRPGGGWETVMEGNVGAMIWDPVDGTTLLVALRNGQLFVLTAPDFQPRQTGILEGKYATQAIWIP